MRDPSSFLAEVKPDCEEVKERKIYEVHTIVGGWVEAPFSYLVEQEVLFSNICCGVCRVSLPINSFDMFWCYEANLKTFLFRLSCWFQALKMRWSFWNQSHVCSPHDASGFVLNLFHASSCHLNIGSELILNISRPTNQTLCIIHMFPTLEQKDCEFSPWHEWQSL